MADGSAVTIAVDTNGADLGPAEVAAGAAIAASQGVRVLLFGPAEAIGEVAEGIEVVDAPVSIAKAPDPVIAVRSTPDASIVQASRAVAEGRAQALVAGGSTGAALAAGLFNIKRASGIFRPALAIPLPVPGKPVTLVDVGANAECRPEHLVQFAFMGAALAQVVLGIEQPRVALLSNGEEAMKGTSLVLETHEKLAASPLRFVGNVEGLDLTSGAADVIVTDGFTGNVVLKTLEGALRAAVELVFRVLDSTPEAKEAGKVVAPLLLDAAGAFDPDMTGGAVLLGVDGVCVISHGSSSARAIVNAVRVAKECVETGVVGRLKEAIDAG
jgi:phosphate acyltransferase